MAKPNQNKKPENLRQQRQKETAKTQQEDKKVLAKIIDVTWNADRYKNILGCHIDLPNKNDTTNSYAIEIVGWVVAKKVKVLGVEIVSENGKVLEEAPVNQPRLGVAKHYPKNPQAKNSGFAIKAGIIGLPLESELMLQAVLEDQSRVELGKLKIRRFGFLHSHYQPKLQPLIITSVGESGSDLLMELLGGHHSLIVNANPTDETLANQYLIKLLELFSHQNYSMGDGLLEENVNSIISSTETNHNEFELKLWWERTYPQKLAAFCQKTIDSLYLQIGKKQGLVKLNKINKSQLTYFVNRYDSTSSGIVELMLDLYPQAKEIILVRDFRDVTYSMLPFSGRSKKGFDRHKYKGFQEFVYDFGKTQVASLLEQWKQRSTQAYLVKYEDLILSPAETLKGILNYLTVDNNETQIEEILVKVAKRKETEQPKKTKEELRAELEFWRKDTPPSLQVLCSEVCSEALQEFGYTES